MVLEEQKRVVSMFLNEHDSFGLERIDATETELSALRDALLQMPFLVAKKLVVVRSVFASKPILELVGELYDQVPDEIDVLFVDLKADKRTRLYKQLQSNRAVQEFLNLRGSALTAWVGEYAKFLGSEIGARDAEYLVDRVGASQMELARELEKLAIDKPITGAIIKSRTDQQLKSSVFELLDTVFSGNADKTFMIYDELLAQKTDPSEIIALIAWQLNIFAVVIYASSKNPADIARIAKIHPYVAGKAVKATTKVTRQDLKKAISMTLDADLKMKTSSGDPKDVLRVLLLKLTSLAKK